MTTTCSMFLERQQKCPKDAKDSLKYNLSTYTFFKSGQT